MASNFIPFVVGFMVNVLERFSPSNLPIIGAMQGGNRQPLTWGQTFWAVFWAILAALAVVGIVFLIIFFVLFAIIISAIEEAF